MFKENTGSFLNQLKQPRLRRLSVRISLKRPLYKRGIRFQCIRPITITLFNTTNIERTLDRGAVTSLGGLMLCLALWKRGGEDGGEGCYASAFCEWLNVLFGGFEEVAVNDRLWCVHRRWSSRW